MNLDNFNRIAGMFNLPSEPPATDEARDGVYVIRVTSTPPVPTMPGSAPLALTVEALGGSAEEALYAYRRLVILRAAQQLAALRDAVARTRAFTIAGDDACAAIEAERAAP